jgi:hypothetical protein
MRAESNSFLRTDICPKFKPQRQTLHEGDEHTNQQCRSVPLEVMNVAEKEWDQLDTQLAIYGQNIEQTPG